MSEKFIVSKSFGYDQDGFKSWLSTKPQKTWNFATIFHPLAEYINETHSTLFTEIALDYYWISGNNYTRRGPLPEWAIVMNERLSKQVNDKKIPFPFRTVDILAVLDQ